MRLIDKDALRERLKELAYEKFTVADWYEFYCDALADADEIIEKQPTIDPVKHGKWIGTWEKGAYTCSECRFIMDTPNDVTTNFCSNCGARMDL